MSDASGGDHGNDASVGARLAAAREARGLALADVAQATRIPLRHLNSIECGDHAGLPAPTYSAGFVKSYARFVGLDGQELSADFRRESGPAVQSRDHMPYEPADPARTPPRALALLALLAAVIGGLGYLYWRGSAEQPVQIAADGVAQSATTVPAAVPAPVGQPTAPAAPTAPAGGAVTIAADKDVWIKVYEEAGKTLYMGVLKGGERFVVPADAIDPKLTTGRPGSTLVTVGDRAIPTLGDPDRLAKNVSLKPDALLARIPAGAAIPPAGATPRPAGAASGPV